MEEGLFPRCFLCASYLPAYEEEVDTERIINSIKDVKNVLGIQIEYDHEWQSKYCCLECYIMNIVIKAEMVR